MKKIKNNGIKMLFKNSRMFKAKKKREKKRATCMIFWNIVWLVFDV